MASTIQGYEGTGRSLSIKLISQIKEEQTRNFKEINLNQAIRYADNDPVERWLNKLLCLDCVKDNTMLFDYTHVNDCELYLVNKDVLFSYKNISEEFLNSIMSLFVSSHYKNTPNDLQLICDSKSHHIFVLTQNLKKVKQEGLPEIYCVIQVAEEGGITRDIIERTQGSDGMPAGDLIPWTLSNYYLDTDFPKLKGVRVVRIAAHPSAQRMGYGKKALDLLYDYYQGSSFNLESVDKKIKNDDSKVENKKTLLLDLNEIEKPQNYSYVGTSFGLTVGLYKFWKNSSFYPLYLKTLQNSITGEHSCIMVRKIENDNIKLNLNTTSFGASNCWLQSFYNDFSKRLQYLFSYEFNKIRIDLAYELLSNNFNEKNEEAVHNNLTVFTLKEIELFLTKEDYKRIKKYSQGLINCNMILDLVPAISFLFFSRKIGKNLSPEQTMILIGVGLQRKRFDHIEKELNSIKNEKSKNFKNKSNYKNVSNFGIDQTTVMGMFKKIIIKMHSYLKDLYEEDLIKKDENLNYQLKNTNGDNSQLKLNDIDETMKINPKEDMFSKDDSALKNDKKIKTEYYSNKFKKQ
jgi:N-acetyltransferase 10